MSETNVYVVTQERLASPPSFEIRKLLSSLVEANSFAMKLVIELAQHKNSVPKTESASAWNVGGTLVRITMHKMETADAIVTIASPFTQTPQQQFIPYQPEPNDWSSVVMYGAPPVKIGI